MGPKKPGGGSVFIRWYQVERLIVVNQFALIQTNGFIGLPEEVGRKNNASIKKAIEESEIVILAWGKANPFEDRQKYVLKLLGQMPEKRCYRTRMHPSRGRYEGFVMPLDESSF